MRTSFCTIAFQSGNKWAKELVVERELSSVIPLLVESQFDGVEIWEPHLRHLSSEQVDAVAKQIRDAGLAVPMLSGYYNFTKSPEHAVESIANGRRVLGLARQVGAKGIRIFTGNTRSGDATEDQWQRCTAALQELCDVAAADGINLALETHDWNLMDTIGGAQRLLKMVDRPNLGLIFQASTFGFDWSVALAALSAHVVHVHASNGRIATKQDIRLDLGVLDYDVIFAALGTLNYRGFISLEWFGADPDGIARHEGPWMRQHLAPWRS